jgi:hypothetical protein
MAVYGGQDIPQATLDLYRSPLTGAFPRLAAEGFSPGDIYIRPLTAQEIQHFCTMRPRWDMMWNQGLEPASQPGEYYEVELLSEIFYMRVYGFHSEIVTDILYEWRRL